jgi:hypothetical protein
VLSTRCRFQTFPSRAITIATALPLITILSKTHHFGKSLTTNKMLRRKPTAITLTTEDVAIYEDARAREALAAREQAALQAQLNVTPQKNNQNRDPNDELRPLPGDRARGAQIKTREERLGLGGIGGSSRA